MKLYVGVWTLLRTVCFRRALAIGVAGVYGRAGSGGVRLSVFPGVGTALLRSGVVKSRFCGGLTGVRAGVYGGGPGGGLGAAVVVIETLTLTLLAAGVGVV